MDDVEIPPSAMRYPVIWRGRRLPSIDQAKYHKWRVLVQARERFAQEIFKAALLAERPENKLYTLLDAVRCSEHDADVMKCLNAGPQAWQRFTYDDSDSTPISALINLPAKVYVIDAVNPMTQRWRRLTITGEHWIPGVDSYPHFPIYTNQEILSEGQQEAPQQEEMQSIKRQDSAHPEGPGEVLIATGSGSLIPAPSVYPLPVVFPRRAVSCHPPCTFGQLNPDEGDQAAANDDQEAEEAKAASVA